MLVRAKRSDIPKLVELVNLAYRSGQGWTNEATLVAGDRITAEQLKAIIDMPVTILMMLKNEQIIGCVQIEHQYDYGYIGMLTTHPELQNQGIGKALLQAAEQYLYEQFSVNTIKMSVLSARHELISFYQRQGYQLTTEVDEYPIAANVGQPILKDLKVLHLIKQRHV